MYVRRRKPNLLARGMPSQSEHIGKRAGERLAVACTIHHHDAAATIPEDGVINKGDLLPVRRNPRIADPAFGRVDSLAKRILQVCLPADEPHRDRKSTRLNSSHLVISYAVFCLKKKTVKPG